MQKILLLISFVCNISLIIYVFQVRSNIPAKEITYPLVKTDQKITVDSENQNTEQILHYNNLRDLLVAQIDKYNLKVDQVGMFLQDAQMGAWLGINETVGFAPASLMKMPIAMGIYKKVADNKLRLTDTVIVTKEDLNDQSGKLSEKGEGYKLTIHDAIEYMIHNSDNTAKNVLTKLVTPEELDTIFKHIGIPNPYVGANGHLVTPRGYIRVFKALYFSTFLSPEYSQKLLDLATDTNEESLIAGGVPPEIQVAHKYGERPDGLSDCGMVYHPRNPYFLCIMTKDVVDISARVTHKVMFSELSRIIYEYVAP